MGRPATLKVDIVADAKGVKKGVDDADSTFSRLGKGAGKAGLAIGAGLAAGAAAVGAFAVSAIGAASDVEQSFGAVESVFGKAAAQVKGYAATAATSVGLAKSEYASLAAVVGSQLQSMGQSQDQSAASSQKLIGLGADLAATFGGSVSDAVGAVGSLLRGERDPIEKYGVAISAADVAARLAAQGQSNLTGEALKQAQAQATLSLLTEKTANAQGAFSRESGTLAGQQARLSAQFENVKATVGSALLPVITRAFGYIGTTVVPIVQRLAAQLAVQLRPAFAAVSQFVQANVVPVLRVLGTYVTGSLVPAIRVVAATVLPSIVAAFRSVTGAVESNRANFAKLQPFIVAVGAAVRAAAPLVGTVLGGAFRLLGSGIGAVIGIAGRLISILAGVITKVRAVSAAIRNSPVGKLAGGIAGLFGGPPLAIGGPTLTGGIGPTLRGGGLATAAYGDANLVADLARLPTGPTVIAAATDARQFHFHGVLDAPDAARRIERLLRDNDVRQGRTAAYGAA